MKKQKISRENLTQIFESGFLPYESERMKEELKAKVHRLLKFMDKMDICDYDKSIGDQFICSESNNKDISAHSLTREIQAIFRLDCIIDGKKFRPKKLKNSYQFPDEVGSETIKFLNDKIKPLRLSHDTFVAYESSLSRFSVAMHLNQISLNNLNHEHIVRFLSTMSNTRSYVVTPIRRFLKYLYEERITTDNLSVLLENIKMKKPIKLISYYSKEEVLKIENSVDRNGRVGKRNYAVILLASRLGLRASDISNLKFSNIDWDRNLIELIQVKTKHSLSLPLLPEVGNAIIDYIMNGRPETGIKNVFLTFTRPYKPLLVTGITSIVDRYMRESNVNFEGKHHGSHSLRHSVATTLMNNEVPLPTISDILGHKSTQSTMCYLSVNIKALIECSLDIPVVEDVFYNQMGGLFYE